MREKEREPRNKEGGVAKEGKGIESEEKEESREGRESKARRKIESNTREESQRPALKSLLG